MTNLSMVFKHSQFSQSVRVSKGGMATTILTAEASDLDIRTPGTLVWVERDGHSLMFRLFEVDTDASGEDIMGWRFRSQGGFTELLIIND